MRLTPAPLLLFFFAGLLAGCAYQEYKPQPIDTVRFADEWQQRRLDDASLQKVIAEVSGKPVAPLANWGLYELTLAAFHFNPDMNVARTRWRSAESAREAAAAFPKPGIASKIEHHSRATGIPAWSFGLGLEIPLVPGDRHIAKLDQAAALGEAARFEVGATAWQIRGQVRSRYMQLITAEAKRKLAHRELSLRREIDDLLTARVAAGVAATGDVTEARLQLRQTSAALSAEASAVQAARGHLAEAIGVPIEAVEGLQLHSTLEGRPVSMPDQVEHRTALLDRYDFRAELARYAASEAKLRLEIARQYPEIVLGPGLVFDQGDHVWSFGASVLSGLFDRNVAGIREATAQRENARQRVLALQAQLISQHAKSVAALDWALGEHITSKQLLEAAREKTIATEKRVAAGHDDRLDLARQRLDALIAERIAIASDVAMMNALASVEDILQHPLDGSFPEVVVLPEASP